MPTYQTGDKSFDLEGRGTSANFVDGPRRGILDWEMLVGDVGLVVFGDTCRWTVPEQRAITRAELRQLVEDIATAIRFPAMLAFRDGSEEIFRPRAGPSPRP